MDEVDAKVMGNLMAAVSAAVVILVGEIDKDCSGLKAHYVEQLKSLLESEDAGPRRNHPAITVLRALIRPLETGERVTLH